MPRSEPDVQDPTDLASLGEEEDDGSVKLKKHFSWWEPEHNENECRDSSPCPEKKCDRYGTGQCAAVEEDPESSPTELSGRRGTGVLSHAVGQDACVHHPLTKVMTIWRTWQRRRRSRCLQLGSVRKQHSDQMFKSSRQKRSQTTPNPSRVLILGKLSVSSP